MICVCPICGWPTEPQWRHEEAAEKWVTEMVELAMQSVANDVAGERGLPAPTVRPQPFHEPGDCEIAASLREARSDIETMLAAMNRGEPFNRHTKEGKDASSGTHS